MTDTVTPRAATGRLTVAPGDTVASVWGNTTFDQTMECFATAGDRDTQWPTPHDGALAYTLDTQTAWLRQTGVWNPMPAGTKLPRGALTQAVATANSSSTTTTVDWITAPAITTDGTRRIKITFNGYLNAGTANDLAGVKLMEGATQLQATQIKMAVAGGPGQQSVSNIWQGVPAAGSHTYKLTVSLASGTGPAIGIASATIPAILLVEDIGQ